MDLIITLGMLSVYIGGLFYVIYRNPLPEQNFEEFAVGGRSFGWAFVTMTIVGTWYPGSLYIGWAQMGVDTGIINTYLVFYTLGSLFVLYIIAGPLWKLGKKYSLKTMGQFFELRYNSRRLRTVMGGVSLLLELPWIVTEMLASGYAIQAITYGRIPFNLGMAIISTIFVAYIVFAGMRAVIIADFYQGWMFLLTGFVLFVVAIHVFFGGLGDMFMQVRNLDVELLTIPGSSAGWGGEAPGALFWPSLIIMGIAGSYMWPSLFSRIFSASSTKEIKSSTRITPFIAVIYATVVLWFAVGVSSRPEFNTGDSAGAMVNMLSSLGPVSVAVIGILIIAGSLSMMDSMVSSWSVVFVNDVVAPYKKISSKGKVNLTRILAIVLGFGGLIISMQELPTIIQLISRMYQGIVQFFPAVVLGLLWKRGNKLSAWVATMIGLVITGIYAFTQPDYVPALNGMQGGLLALIVNFIVYIILGFIGKPEKDTKQLFIDMTTPDENLVPIEFDE